MPDEREMEEINDVMTPAAAPAVSLSRHERRQQARDQARANRVSGIVTCELCLFSLDLDHEPKPEDCPACGEPYDSAEWDTRGGEPTLEQVCLERRRCFALESQAESTAQLAEGVGELVTLIGEIAHEIIEARRGTAGGPPRATRR